MADTENQKVKTPREQLLERMSSRYPDRHFVGQDGQDAQDDLEQAIIETLDEVKDKNSQLAELFSTDPRSAEFIGSWIRTGDPRGAIIETFGDEFFDAAKSEEAREKFKGELEEWRARKKADDDARAEYEENWNKSLEDLENWGNEKGLSQEDKVKVILRLADVSENAIRNIFSPDDFEMAYNAMNYANDVNTAHDTGVIEGRNAKIAERRKSIEDAGKLPPAVTGQGVRAKEPAPPVPRKENPWAGLR